MEINLGLSAREVNAKFWCRIVGILIEQQIPRCARNDNRGVDRSVNVGHGHGRLKEFGAADGKFAAAGAANQNPSLGVAKDEWPLALGRQHAQHQHALAIRAGGALGEFGEMAGIERHSGS